MRGLSNLPPGVTDQMIEDAQDDGAMEELERERLERTLAALTRVALGQSNYDDAFFLAAELGVRHLWPSLKEFIDAHNTEVRQPPERG